MRSVIHQSVLLPAAPQRLFESYLDADTHARITGKPVKIAAEPGSEFEAFDGVLTGTMLRVVAPRLIVQSWRSTQFRERDPDSTLILMMSRDGDDGRIDLVHLDVPEHDYDGVQRGWNQYYWDPWRAFLASR